MKKIVTRKRIVFLAVLAVAGITAIGAYAWFTAGGHGTGSATVGTSVDWHVHTDGATGASALTPDGPSQSVSFYVTNNNVGTQHLNQVVVSVAKSDGTTWSVQGDTSKPACTASDFSLDGGTAGASETFTTDLDVASSATELAGTVSIQMVDNGLNQDNCKGVTVPLYLVAS